MKKATRGSPPGLRVHMRAIDGGKLKLRSVALDAAGHVVTERSKLTDDQRQKLLARARAGELVSVQVEAITFIQRATPNRNLTRISDKELGAFAASFEGRPVLRDHAHDNSLARAGRVLSSTLEKRPDEHGASQIRMTMELTAPWAVELALRDLTNEFSVAWHSAGDAVCSICATPMAQVWSFMVSACQHEVGQPYGDKICQVEFTDVEGIEVSLVNVPAVQGVGIEHVGAQLAANGAPPALTQLSAAAPVVTAATSSPSMAQLCGALGLAVTAGFDELLAAVTTLRSDLDAARQALVAHEAAALEAALDREIERGIAEGRLGMKRDKDGQRIESAIEKGIRRMGRAHGIESAREFLNELPPGTASPLGVAPRSLSADPTPRTEPLTEQQKHINRLIGVTDAAVAKHIAAERRTTKG